MAEVLDRTTCPECGRTVPISRTGRVLMHDRTSFPGGTCEGAYREVKR